MKRQTLQNLLSIVVLPALNILTAFVFTTLLFLAIGSIGIW
ncbi:MAG: hypothetical protein R3E89_11760 [Thiolinea sp.]